MRPYSLGIFSRQWQNNVLIISEVQSILPVFLSAGRKFSVKGSWLRIERPAIEMLRNIRAQMLVCLCVRAPPFDTVQDFPLVSFHFSTSFPKTIMYILSIIRECKNVEGKHHVARKKKTPRTRNKDLPHVSEIELHYTILFASDPIDADRNNFNNCLFRNSNKKLSDAFTKMIGIKK